MSARAKESFQITELLNNAQSSYENGDYENALDCALQALILIEESLDKFHSDRLCCYSALGLIYSDLGDQEKSYEYMVKLEEIVQDPQLKDSTLGIHYKLHLISFYRQREFQQHAGDLLLEVQTSLNDAYENCSEEDRPDILDNAKDAYSIKSRMDIEAGLYEEAVGALDLALSYCEELNGPSDVSNAEILIERARANNKLLQYDRARSDYERAFAIYQEHSGTLGVSVGFLAGEIAHFFLSIGNLELAQKIAKRSILAFHRSLGSNSIEYADANLLLADILLLEERYDEASELGLKALHTARLVLKEDMRELLPFLATVSNILSIKGDTQQAKALEKEFNDLTKELDSQ